LAKKNSSRKRLSEATVDIKEAGGGERNRKDTKIRPSKRIDWLENKKKNAVQRKQQ